MLRLNAKDIFHRLTQLLCFLCLLLLFLCSKLGNIRAEIPKSEVVVSEDDLLAALEDRNKIASHARTSIVERNSNIYGVKILGIRYGSIYEKVGIKNGDIVTSVNNSPLANPAQIIQIFDTLSQEQKISLALERNGKELELLCSVSPAKYGSAGKKTKNSYTITEAQITSALANLPALATQAQVVPANRAGKIVGIQLVAVQAGSLYEQLGLRQGDIITFVNKVSLSNPTEIMRLFQDLKTLRSVGITLERNGKPVDLHYSLR